MHILRDDIKQDAIKIKKMLEREKHICDGGDDMGLADWSKVVEVSEKIIQEGVIS